MQNSVCLSVIFGHSKMSVASTFVYFLLLMLVHSNNVSVQALYTDEPLLYDTFPPGFMWAAATSAYQVLIYIVNCIL